VDTFSSGTAGNNNSDNRDIDIITAVLESGNGVELSATGYSMFPALRPGNMVTVKTLPEGVLPDPGSVVVYRESNILVMHRLLEITDDNGNLQFITRGDSRMESDKPWTQQQFLGVAVVYKGINRECAINTFIPPPWRYKYNRWLLWLYLIIKRVTGG
jgi:signal peptidase I